MSETANLGLPYIQPAQAQKHVTHNEAIRMLDAVVQLSVLDRTRTTPPASPAEGDRHIVASPAGGAWAGREGDVAAFQDGAWAFLTPQAGWLAWSAADAGLFVHNSLSWTATGGGGSSESAPFFGVNTTADTTNRLAVKSDAVLFNHDDVTPGNDDCRIVVNKKTIGDTASVLCQTGASGRAEIGLTGDDAFHIKVSADGAAWKEALVVDNATGYVAVNDAAPEAPLHVDDDAGLIALFKANNTNAFVHFRNHGGAVDQRLFTFNVRGVGEARFLLQARDDTFGLVRNLIQYYHDGSIVVGGPSGGPKGAGSLNAQAVYDDNTVLSCYVFDQALDGEISDAKWDAKVPDRIIEARTKHQTDPETGRREEIVVNPQRIEKRNHAPMRRFRERIGTAHDPITLDGYARHWKEKRHLSSMPNETRFAPETGLAAGEWIQRLVETVEVQAVLIESLNEATKDQDGRIEALENRKGAGNVASV